MLAPEINPRSKDEMAAADDRSRPFTSPSRPPLSHTSHAMMMQVNEYRARVRQAVASTYNFALQPPPSSPSSPSHSSGKRPVSSSLSSSSHRSLSQQAREQAAMSNNYYAGAALAKDAVLPRRSGGYVAFHKIQARRGEFLLGESADRRAARMLAGASSVSTPSGIAKDHFALGPGQYDVATSSNSTHSAKFSPADRFRDDYTAGKKPEPGQYVTQAGEALVSPRAAAAVFSQVPRRTDESMLLPNTSLNQQQAPSPRRQSGGDEEDEGEASGCGRTGYPAASSWYYYQPPSGFAPKYDKQNDRESWARAPRFTGRHRWQRATTKGGDACDANSDKTDFVENNKRKIHAHAAVQRVRRARGAEDKSPRPRSPPSSPMPPPPAAFKRRESLFLPPNASLLPRRHGEDGDRDDTGGDDGDRGDQKDPVVDWDVNDAPAARSTTDTASSKPTSLQSTVVTPRRRSSATSAASTAASASPARRTSNSSSFRSSHDLLAAVSAASPHQINGWSTVYVLASFPRTLCARFRVAIVIRGVQRAYGQHCTRQALASWKLLNKQTHQLYARALIAKNAFRYRFKLRLERKARQAALLREFLRGLSVDVRFALAMKRVKRRVQLLQRWWRHAQLMVRARELALYYKWVTVEARLRLEYLNQLPHLHRVFQPPRQRIMPVRRSSAALASSPTPGLNPSGGADAAASARNDEDRHGDDGGMPLHRLLNLPEQHAWFSARFSLTADGVLRGWDAYGGEVMVELRGYRCYLHDYESDDSDSDSEGEDDQDSQSSGDAQRQRQRRRKWRPYLMLFRPSAFRFVLLSTRPSPSPSSSPDELHDWLAKLERAFAATTTSSSSSGGSRAGVSVRELVDVSMQSGILSTPRNSSEHSGAATSSSSSLAVPASPAATTATSSPRGKLQARVRSIRQSRGSRIGAIGMSSSSLAQTVLLEGELHYYVVDLLKDLPKVPQREIWQTVRDKLREKRKLFRAEIHRFQLESAHFRQHQEQVRGLQVPDKFRDFFVSVFCVLVVRSGLGTSRAD